MEANSLPPDPKAPVVYDSNALESTVVDNTPLANLSNAQNYPIEALEVRDESNAAHTPTNQPPPQFSSAGMGSVPFSRKRAATVSLGITIIVMIFTGGIMAVLVKGRLATKEAANRDVPTQGITLESSSTGVNPVELQKDQQSLLVSGDIITRGELQISSGGFVTTLRSQPLTGSQIITLPAESGTICLDSNNCNFVSQSQLAEVQGQIVDATTVNNNSGDITLQGTTNQVSVTTNGQVITFTTPQNLHTAASVQFADLRLSGTLRTDTIRTNTTGGNLAVTADAAQLFFVDRSRTFSFPAGGLASQTICTSQNNCNYGTGNGDIVNGGQIGPIVIGTDDASTLAFETNNTQRIILQSSGNVAIDTTTLTIDAVNNRVGVGTATPTAKLEVSGGSLLVTGTHTGTSEISVTGSGTRMFFDVGRSAFRAGAAVGDSWDSNWLGLYSAAFGQNTRASQWGFAAGQSTTAASQAVAFGAGTNASGTASSALGWNTTAQAFGSMAIGQCNVAQGTTGSLVSTDTAFAVGNGTYNGGTQSCDSRSNAFQVAYNGSTTVNGGSMLVQGTHGGGNGISVTGAGTRMFFDVNKSAFRAGSTTTNFFDDANVGQYSFAAGNNVFAVGNGSAALGVASRADWDNAMAFGFNARGAGSQAMAMGYYTQSQAYASQAFGVCNAYSGNTSSWNATDQLFTIGNGTLSGLGLSCATRANALEMTKNGNLAVDTNTLYVDAVNNRVGIGTATPISKLEVVESSTDTTAAGLSGATITVTDTGVVTTGTDQTSGLSVTVNRSGATGGTIQVIGGSFSAVTDTGGSSVAVGVQGLGVGADDVVGVQGLGFISTSGALNSAIGVNGSTGTYFAAGTTITNAYGLQGSFSMDLGAATITNVAGLNIKTATNTSGGTIANNYGIRVENQSAGANDYGLYIEGADTYALWVDSGATRLDGTLTVAEHAAVGAGAIIDGFTVAAPFLGASSFNSVLTVAEDITDFSKDFEAGIVNGITANPTAAYSGAIIGIGNEVALGGSESVTGLVAGSTNIISTTDSIDVDTVYGSYNIVALSSTGDVAAAAANEVNTLQVDNAITGSVVGSINQVGVNGTGGGAAAGAYSILSAGTSPEVTGLAVDNSISGGTVTNQNGITIALQSSGGSTVTTAVGLQISDVVHTGTVTDSYGVRVGTSSGAANNYGVYVAGGGTYAVWVDDGVSRFDGNVAINATTAANKLNLNTLTTADADAQLAVSTDGNTNKGIVVQGVASQSADLFQAQDSTGAVLASISATGDLTVETATINGTLTVNGNATINGHVISGNTSGSTTAAAGAAADCSASGLVNISGNDTAGTITITTSTGACAPGTLATITFANAYGNAPEVVITPKDANGASLQYYNGSATTAAFTIDTGVGATTSTVYTYSYHVIE